MSRKTKKQQAADGVIFITEPTTDDLDIANDLSTILDIYEQLEEEETEALQD